MSDFSRLEKRYDWYDHRIQWLWGYLFGLVSGCVVSLLCIVLTAWLAV